MSIGSHIIPRFYLEQFSNPAKRKGRPGKVWTYEKGKPTHPRATDAQGYENGYFAQVQEDGQRDESFEAKLAELEARCNDALVCAKSELYEFNLTNKNTLALYMGLLSARSSARKKFTAGNWAKLKEPFSKLEFNDEYVNDTAAHFSETTGEIIKPDLIREMIRKHAATFTENNMIGNTFVQTILFHAEVMKKELVPRPWQVWKAPTGTEFVTSDNPVVTFIRLREDAWHPGHGFRTPGVVIAFPLAPTACLTIGIEGWYFRDVDEATVIQMNEVTVRCCDRFVYSKTFDKGIEEMVNSFARTSVPGVNAFVGQFPGTEQIEAHLRKTMGIRKRTATSGK
ncbi:MAG TPA: DUF4238 domain-containing protein [Candidatus Sulfotelmatobacter sp.]|jgi:hypothetical protein|nr:DUF4238 domain-containing protein [Candidatus Sulfotelmatobacter sp.]